MKARIFWAVFCGLNLLVGTIYALPHGIRFFELKAAGERYIRAGGLMPIRAQEERLFNPLPLFFMCFLQQIEFWFSEINFVLFILDIELFMFEFCLFLG